MFHSLSSAVFTRQPKVLVWAGGVINTFFLITYSRIRYLVESWMRSTCVGAPWTSPGGSGEGSGVLGGVAEMDRGPRCAKDLVCHDNGWICGVEEYSEWIQEPYAGQTTHLSVRLVARLRLLLGKVTHLCRVYKIVTVTSVFPVGTTFAAGKES